MKLFYSPGACSLGIHFLLEEIGAPYALEMVELAKGAQHQPAYKGINPKAKVPALQLDDGQLLTEFPAIAVYLARTHPARNWLPEGALGEARALELLDYMVATMHMRGYTRMFRPGMFALRKEDEPAVREAGREIVNQGFLVLEPVLGARDWIMGEFSVVEAALFYIETWARLRAKMPMPAAFEAHYDRLLARPAAQKVLRDEGLI